MRDLTGRTVLVTSGARNLGANVSAGFARAGATVAISHRRSARAATDLAARLSDETGVRHVAVAGDVATPDGVHDLVAGAVDALGRDVDVLVNNVGPYLATPYEQLSVEDWHRVVATNLRAVYLATREVAPGMRSSGWGRVLNVSAVSAYVRDRSVYALVKHAVNVLTEELALELGPEITVNAIAPGQIAESLPDLEEVAPAWAQEVVRATPLQRLVTRDELAGALVALCGPTFDAVTGVTVPLDGGLRLNRLG